MTKMMKCGHASSGLRLPDEVPVCAICYGVREGADEVAPEQPDLTGRQARCTYDYPGSRPHPPSLVPSDPALAFFSHQPDQQYDEYYCGCRVSLSRFYGWGWD